MSVTQRFGSVLLLSGLLGGCNSPDGPELAVPKTDVEKPATATAKLETARVESKQAVAAVREYGHAEKAEFVAGLRKELAETQAELDALAAQAEKVDEARKAEARATLEAARLKWRNAVKAAEDAERATESDWDEVKTSARNAYGDFKASVTSTRQWMSEKIAP